MIKGLLFDLDGTLVCTKKANYLSYKEAYATIGVELLEEDYSKVFGLRFDDMVELITPGLSDSLKNKIKISKSKFYKKYLKVTRLNHVLVGMIKNSTHMKKALVTTASKNNALEVLRFYNLEDLFDAYVFGEDVTVGKPSPESYNLGIKALDMLPDECLIFEDTLVGVCAGEDSGASVLNISGWCSHSE